MRGSRTRVIAALVTGGFVLSLTAGQSAVGAPAAAPTSRSAGQPIGGPQLGAGLAVNLTPGIMPLPAMLTPKAWLVADLDTGQVLGAFDAHVEHKPASTLKTLAALALIPKINPAAAIPFTDDELNLTAQKDGRTTRIGLVPGQSYPAKRLFEAMLSLSANDATEALAAAAPGGRAATLAAMNTIATTLQANDTHAATPDGLDGTGQQISAYDLALIARAAIAVPGFTAYNTVPIVHVPSSGKPLGGGNHDRLQNSASLLHGATVIAGKDGYTTDSGQVWWGAAQKNGHRIIVTEMDAGFEPVTQEIDLLNWGFAVDGKIAPAGMLVPPVSAAGVPEPLASVAAVVPVAPVAKHVAAARKSHGGSGAWTWILGFLVVLAAATLGRRHFLAARPTAGQRLRGTGPQPAGGGGPSAVPVLPAEPSDVIATLPLDDTAEHPMLERSTPAARPARTPRDPRAPREQRSPRRPEQLKPWQAPVSDRSVILRSSSAAGRDVAPGRRVDTTLDTRVESWRASRAEPDSAEQARADRLRSGAVKVIPAPTPPADDESAPRNRR